MPQGSLLGPLFFLNYVNDIGNACSDACPKLFADDTNVLVTVKSPAEVEHKANLVCKNLSNWFKVNRLRLNTSKSCYILIKPEGA